MKAMGHTFSPEEEAKIGVAINRALAVAPPLTLTQIHRLQRILRGRQAKSSLRYKPT